MISPRNEEIGTYLGEDSSKEHGVVETSISFCIWE